MKRWITDEELNLIRQWFNAVEDINQSYLEDKDYELNKKILKMLNWEGGE